MDLAQLAPAAASRAREGRGGARAGHDDDVICRPGAGAWREAERLRRRDEAIRRGAPMDLGLGLGIPDPPASGGGVVTPAQIAGLFAWYRADLGATLNVAALAALADQSGGGRGLAQATGARQPAYTASDALFGGRASFTCARAAIQWIGAAAAAPWAPISSGAGVTLFMVVEPVALDGGFLWGTTGATGTTVGAYMASQASGNIRFGVGNGAATVVQIDTTSAGYAVGAAHIIIATFSTAAGGVVRVDRVQRGAQATQNTPSAAAPVNPLGIGANGGGGGPTDQRAAEWAAWSRVLAGSEIAQLETYAAGYGI